MFDKVLVANRGEIATRIIHTLDRMGIASVAVYSDADAESPYVRQAGEAIAIGGTSVQESYLRIDRILEAARKTGAQAIHPGYGLLSENPEFVLACEAAGLVFIGPGAEAMQTMGSKISSRVAMQRAGVPVVPGTTEPVTDRTEARAAAEEIGYPIAVKASAAGGGKGFRVARSETELDSAIEGASGEGERFFGDGRVYLERYLENPRHIEVQILGDAYGSVVHLFERDCSVQRRHQKLIEEAPAPQVSPQLREQIGHIAVQAAQSVGYVSAGTVEGLLVGTEYFFLEMNTRIQVEHGVTELVTGIDLVEQQILIAAGEPLSFAQDEIRLRGHAIECRINAERADRGFLPAPGRITRYHEPTGSGIRVDSGVEAGTEVSSHYDPMLAKLLVLAEDRESATRRMLEALSDFHIEGISTLVPFHLALLSTPQWRAGETCADLVGNRSWLKAIPES